jgi:hypothetical protein
MTTINTHCGDIEQIRQQFAARLRQPEPGRDLSKVVATETAGYAATVQAMTADILRMQGDSCSISAVNAPGKFADLFPNPLVAAKKPSGMTIT